MMTHQIFLVSPEVVGQLIPPGPDCSHSLLFLLFQTLGHLIPPGLESSHSFLLHRSQPSQDLGHLVAKLGEEVVDGDDDHEEEAEASDHRTMARPEGGFGRLGS